MNASLYSPVWCPAVKDPIFANVVDPFVDQWSKTDIFRDSGAALDLLKDLSQSDHLIEYVDSNYSKISSFGASILSYRRCASLLPIAITARVVKSPLLPNDPASLNEAVNFALGYQSSLLKVMRGLSDFKAQKGTPRSAIPTLSRTETERVLPLLCMWQLGGPAIESIKRNPRLLENPELAKTTSEFLRIFAHQLPEIDPQTWRNHTAFEAVRPMDSIVIKSWALGVQVPLDPSQNPRTKSELWAAQNEPLFDALCSLMRESAGPVASQLSASPQILLDDREKQALGNLANPDNPFNVRTWFSQHRTAVLNSESRNGTKIEDPLRAQLVRQVFDLWCEKLSEMGTPYIAEVHNSSSSLLHNAADETLQANIHGLKQSSSPISEFFSVGDIFSIENPNSMRGEAHALNALLPLLRHRAQLAQSLFKVSGGEKFEDSWGPSEAALVRQDLNNRIRLANEIGLLHALNPSEVSTAPNEAMASLYWRRVFALPSSPLFGIDNPESLLKQLTPHAYFQSLSDQLDAIVPDLGKSSKNALLESIWVDASKTAARYGEAVSYEECVLAGAMRAAYKHTADTKFGLPQAWALAFCAGMGSGSVRLPDVTRACQRARGMSIQGRLNFSDSLLLGSAGMLCQLATDWTRFAEKQGGDKSRDPIIAEISKSNAKLTAWLSKVSGNPGKSLGVLLKDPRVWEQLLPASDSRDAFVRKVCSEANIRPSEAFGSLALLVQPAGSHPIVPIEASGPLQAFSLATVGVSANSVPPVDVLRRFDELDNAVVSYAATGLSPLLDRVVTEPLDRPQIRSMVSLLKVASDSAIVIPREYSASTLYLKEVARMGVNYEAIAPLLSQRVPEGTDAAMPMSLLNELLESDKQAFSKSKDKTTILRLLTSLPSVPGVEQVSKLRDKMTRVFVPNAVDKLYSNKIAVVWATAIQRALKTSLISTPLEMAVADFLKVDESAKEALNHGRIKNNKNIKEELARWDAPYTKAAAPVFQNLRSAPLPPAFWSTLKDEFSAVINSSVFSQALSAEREFVRQQSGDGYQINRHIGGFLSAALPHACIEVHNRYKRLNQQLLTRDAQPQLPAVSQVSTVPALS